MRRFLVLALVLLALVAAAQAARTPRLRKLQEESDAGQGSEDHVDVDKQQQLATPPASKGAVDDHDPNHAGHDQHAGHSHRTLGAVDDHDPNHAGHDQHMGHNHLDAAVAAEGAEGSGDKQGADPRAGLCKMPGQSPCPNGPGTCTLLFCECATMGNCRYIDPPKL